MTDPFATDFIELFRDTYVRAVRRIPDKRARLSPETIGLLQHLAMSGPLTLSELAKHLKRAPSTLSEMVDHLAGKALLERDRDPADARRTLIWLTEAGHAALNDAQQVLDTTIIAEAAQKLTPDERLAFLRLFRNFVSNLKGDPL